MPARLSARAALRIGQVPQDVPADLGHQPVREVLAQSLAKVGQDGEDWRIDVLIDEIGVDPEMLDRPFGTLSGGWQRLMLIAAAARLEEPDILILDEPTNHLDLANINTLERWLTAEFAVPMLIVSHDREFLDRVTEAHAVPAQRRRPCLQDALLDRARGAAAS